MKAGPALLLATLFGLVAAAAAIGWVGFAPVLAAAERIGWTGFAGLCLYSGFPLVLLGLGWWAVTPDAPRPAAFIWARTAREGASDVLPFAGFGGLIVGARTIARFGVPPARAWAGMVADLSTELAAQLVFTLYGVGALALMLGGEGAHPHLWPLVAAGTGAAFAIFGLFAVFQRRGLAIAGALAERMLPGAVKTTEGIAAELRASYARRCGIAAAFVLNLGAWVASGAGAWIRAPPDEHRHSAMGGAFGRGAHLHAALRGVHDSRRVGRAGGSVRDHRSALRPRSRDCARAQPRQARARSGDRSARAAGVAMG